MNKQKKLKQNQKYHKTWNLFLILNTIYDFQEFN
jgi:hypothetical protein